MESCVWWKSEEWGNVTPVISKYAMLSGYWQNAEGIKTKTGSKTGPNIFSKVSGSHIRITDLTSLWYST